MYTQDEPWLEAAAVGSIPGPIVVIFVGLSYLGLIALMILPGEHHIRGEIYEFNLHEWE